MVLVTTVLVSFSAVFALFSGVLTSVSDVVAFSAVLPSFPVVFIYYSQMMTVSLYLVFDSFVLLFH